MLTILLLIFTQILLGLDVLAHLSLPRYQITKYGRKLYIPFASLILYLKNKIHNGTRN